MPHTALIQRKTAETEIELELNLDGAGNADVKTGVGFLDHMLELLAKHGALDLRVARRAISTTAQASSGCHLGKRISVSNSPGRQSVAKYPRKKSAAATRRAPDLLLNKNSPPRSRLTAGSSAAGSA